MFVLANKLHSIKVCNSFLSLFRRDANFKLMFFVTEYRNDQEGE